MTDEDMPRRRRLGVKRELLLALAPTLTVLLVLALVEAVSRQRLLFASLASSAFLIYLDPGHTVNKARTLILSQVGGACIGMAAAVALGPGKAWNTYCGQFQCWLWDEAPPLAVAPTQPGLPLYPRCRPCRYSFSLQRSPPNCCLPNRGRRQLVRDTSNLCETQNSHSACHGMCNSIHSCASAESQIFPLCELLARTLCLVKSEHTSLVGGYQGRPVSSRCVFS
jgi:hypothetical protein